MKNSKFLIIMAVIAIAMIIVIGIYVLSTPSYDLGITGAIDIELLGEFKDFEIGVPQFESLRIKNLANSAWQIQISAFNIWGGGGFHPSGVTLKWKLEPLSSSLETVELYGHEGFTGYTGNRRIDLPARCEGILTFELTFTSAPAGYYSHWLHIDIYDPESVSDYWEWQNTINFEIVE
jgi:hypothetical protein